jgi:hypothetical protein
VDGQRPGGSTVQPGDLRSRSYLTQGVQKTIDLTSFRGQSVVIKFTGVEDSSLQTSFLIDDTELNVR